MAKISPEAIKRAQRVMDAVPGSVPSDILAAWQLAWEGRCVDPTCPYGKHQMSVGLTITDDRLTDQLPAGKICVIQDAEMDWDARVPLTKQHIVELIADLRQMLDAMP